MASKHKRKSERRDAEDSVAALPAEKAVPDVDRNVGVHNTIGLVEPSADEVMAQQGGAGFNQHSFGQSFGDGVTLVNRTSRTLNVKFHGRDYPIPPGPSYGFPVVMVRYAREQNVLMGSQDLFKASSFVSLVGVAGRDDVSPLEQSNAVERIDRRTTMGEGRKAVRVEGAPIRASEARIGGEDDDEGDGFIDGVAAAAHQS